MNTLIAVQLAANLTARCTCDWHDEDGHSDECCTYRLCVDCLHYAIGS